MIIFIPHLKITKIFVNSIIIPLILSCAYVYIIYKSFLLGENFFAESLNLYVGLNDLYTILSTEQFLLIFWLHFIALNIFLGSWVSYNSLKYNIPRTVVFVPLILIYFSGPVGLFLYWFIRIFYAKKIGLYD
tara:strand:- start:141 stop:536 length:396 start_codon:yes stop_codon:yes gene_type:complete